MSLLLPIGFIGLLGIAVLILIYIIKPNYQQKFVSSTFVWKLSLKYQKKRIPISKLKNILIFLCQLLILALCAFLLTKPVLPDAAATNASVEKIIIIDASASMRAQTDGKTRYERAVDLARTETLSVLENGGVVSVIFAGKEAEFLCHRYSSESSEEAKEIFDGLLERENNDYIRCTYGNGDIQGAVKLSESIVALNDNVEIILYTGVKYNNSSGIKVVDVAEPSEWNVAILDVRAEIVDSFYSFYIDVSCYGADMDVDVSLVATEVNGDAKAEKTFTVEDVRLTDNRVRTIEIDTALIDDDAFSKIFQFNSLNVYVEVNDSFPIDNSFNLFGGIKHTLKVQYASNGINKFTLNALYKLREQLPWWDIVVSDVESAKADYEGYDLYIFEHVSPDYAPRDGVTFIVDPNKAVPGINFSIDGYIKSPSFDQPYSLTLGAPHPLTNYFDLVPLNIKVNAYKQVSGYNDFFTPVLYCAGNPVLLARNEPDSKILLMTMSYEYTDLTVDISYPILMYNIFMYYLSPTVDKYTHDVYDSISVNARGKELFISGPHISLAPEKLPYILELNYAGIYTFTQKLQNDIDFVEQMFVKIPSEQSNIKAVKNTLDGPVSTARQEKKFIDLLVYFAAAVVALLFAEWWLHSRTES